MNHCNITNPEIISNITPKCSLDIQGNKIDEKYIDELIEISEKHKGKIEMSNPTILKISKTIKSKTVNLSDYDELASKLDFSKIDDLKIIIDDEFNISEETFELINRINELKNATIVSNPQNYIAVNEKNAITLKAKMIIKDASELSSEQLEKCPYIYEIEMKDGLNTFGEVGMPYAVEEYMTSIKKLEEILSNMPKFKSQKELFTEIYKRLAKHIEYDHRAISEEEKKNKKLQRTCRNLYGGLVEGKCVCAGYANILRNACACVGIEAKYIAAPPNFDGGYAINIKDPEGHAWNSVNLDGEDFFTDLTWDRNNVVMGKFPLKYFLKSTIDFEHEEFSGTLFEEMKKSCIRSISVEEQQTLFGYKKSQPVDKENTRKELSKNYLSSCVISSASLGLKASQINNVHNLLKSSSIDKATNIIKKER